MRSRSLSNVAFMVRALFLEVAPTGERGHSRKARGIKSREVSSRASAHRANAIGRNRCRYPATVGPGLNIRAMAISMQAPTKPAIR